MKENPVSTPWAILIGSVLISFSILLSSGVIKIKGLQTGSTAALPGTPTTAQQQQPQAPSAPQTASVDLGHLPAKGDQNAKVAVVEFADLRCPFCEKFYTDSEPSLLKDYVDTGKVKFSFRHYQFLGPASTLAGNAAECANEQGKFWEFYDYMYKNQPPESDTSMYTVDKLTPIAQSLGISGDQFKSCLSANKYDKQVSQDLSDGQAAGVSGTPTFIVGKLDSSGKKITNGKLIVGAVPYATIKSAIDSAL